MAIKISKADLISRFTTRVKDFITANTNWVASTAVWNTNVNGVTSASQSVYGGPYNRTASASVVAEPAMVISDLPSKLNTSSSAGVTLVTVLRNFLVQYANNHKITLQNTGNLTPASYVGVVKLNDLESSIKNAIISDVNSLAITNNIVNNKVIKEIDIDGFIDDCKDIWINRCFNTAPEIFYYGFCHSSCHSNHSSHGSRGRR